jgi:hypothetical protein
MVKFHAVECPVLGALVDDSLEDLAPVAHLAFRCVLLLPDVASWRRASALSQNLERLKNSCRDVHGVGMDNSDPAVNLLMLGRFLDRRQPQELARLCRVASILVKLLSVDSTSSG